MIIQNGYIEFITVTGGGLDPVTGHPIPVSGKEYGELIPCQFVPARANLLAKSKGEPVTDFSWTIYIESLWRDIATERIRLKDMMGNIVGEYSIIRCEPLVAVCQYVITV